jgi:hypothetical protein
MDIREVGCKDGSWMELAKDRVQWQCLALSGSAIRVLIVLLENHCLSYVHVQCCEMRSTVFQFFVPKGIVGEVTSY